MQRRSSRWRERETETREDSYREWRHCGSTFQKELFAAPYHYTTIKHNHNVLICPENNNRPTTSAYLSMPRLSLFGIHSLSQTHTHKPIFHPKIGCRSLLSSTNHSFSSTPTGTVPSLASKFSPISKPTLTDSQS